MVAVILMKPQCPLIRLEQARIIKALLRQLLSLLKKKLEAVIKRIQEDASRDRRMLDDAHSTSKSVFSTSTSRRSTSRTRGGHFS